MLLPPSLPPLLLWLSRRLLPLLLLPHAETSGRGLHLHTTCCSVHNQVVPLATHNDHWSSVDKQSIACVHVWWGSCRHHLSGAVQACAPSMWLDKTGRVPPVPCRRDMAQSSGSCLLSPCPVPIQGRLCPLHGTETLNPSREGQEDPHPPSEGQEGRRTATTAGTHEPTSLPMRPHKPPYTCSRTLCLLS